MCESLNIEIAFAYAHMIVGGIQNESKLGAMGRERLPTLGWKKRRRISFIDGAGLSKRQTAGAITDCRIR